MMRECPAAKEELRRTARIARRYGMAEELGQAALVYTGRFMHERGTGDRRVITLLEDGEAMLPEDAGTLRARVLAPPGRRPPRPTRPWATRCAQPTSGRPRPRFQRPVDAG